MALEEYRKKRDFRRTGEPRGRKHARRKKALHFVVQKHAASRLHYDFRLELDGVLKSWAVPRGPSLDPKAKRLAVHVEDHPIEYGSFEGVIPDDEYGGGTVLLWDTGEWIPEGDANDAYRKGRLSFSLEGEKLHGNWSLVRTRGRDSDVDRNWLLIKRTDEAARPGDDDGITKQRPESVATGRELDVIAREAKRDEDHAGRCAQGRPGRRFFAAAGHARRRAARRGRLAPRAQAGRLSRIVLLGSRRRELHQPQR
jgi:bifunctional non-homologous end joining protein LigD